MSDRDVLTVCLAAVALMATSCDSRKMSREELRQAEINLRDRQEQMEMEKAEEALRNGDPDPRITLLLRKLSAADPGAETAGVIREAREDGQAKRKAIEKEIRILGGGYLLGDSNVSDSDLDVAMRTKTLILGKAMDMPSEASKEVRTAVKLLTAEYIKRIKSDGPEAAAKWYREQLEGKKPSDFLKTSQTEITS